MALAKTGKPIGMRLRRFLADNLLPQLARDGQYLPEREAADIPPPIDDLKVRRLAIAEAREAFTVAINRLRSAYRRLRSSWLGCASQDHRNSAKPGSSRRAVLGPRLEIDHPSKLFGPRRRLRDIAYRESVAERGARGLWPRGGKGAVMFWKEVLLAVCVLGLSLSGCDELEQAFDCKYICDRYTECVDESYDTSACVSRCRDNAASDDSFAALADACESCLDDRSCVESITCTRECVGIVP